METSIELAVAGNALGIIAGVRTSDDGNFLQFKLVNGNWSSYFDLRIFSAPIKELQQIAATNVRVSPDSRFLQWKTKDSDWYDFFDLAVLTNIIDKLEYFADDVNTIKANDITYRAGQRFVEPFGALVNENGYLLVPKLRYQKADGTWALASPPGGAAYWELLLSDDQFRDPVAYYFDVASSQVATNFNELGQAGNIGDALHPLIAMSWAGAVSTPYQLARVRPNEYAYNVYGQPAVVGDGTTRVPITDGTLLSYGIYQGWRHSSGQVFFGGQIRRPIVNQRFFARVFCLTDKDNDFPPIAIYVRGVTEGQTNPRNFMVMEKQYGPRVASFIRSIDTLSTDLNSTALCVQAEPSTNRPGIVLAGFQYCTGWERNLWCMRSDNPWHAGEENDRLHMVGATKQHEILHGPLVCLIEGRPQALYPGSLTVNRDAVAPVTTFEADGGDDHAGTPYVVTSRDTVPLDPARLRNGQPVRIITTRAHPFADQRQWIDATIKITTRAALAGKAPKILLMGDSFIQSYVFKTVLQALVAAGASPTQIGTMYGSTFGGLYRREGRSGSSFGDWINARTDFLQPVTDVAAYNTAPDTGSTTAKNKLNPFVFNSSGAGSYNGQKFDFGRYLSTYGVAQPDVVVINLGINDMSDFDTADALATFVKTALGIMVPSIRAAGDGTTRVLLTAVNTGWSNEQNQLWEDKFARGIVKAQMGYVRGLADPKVRFVPVFAYQDPHGWNEFTSTRTDPDSGTATRGNINDAVHAGRHAAIHQYGECVAAYIADMI